MKIKRIYIEITNNCNLHCSFCVPNSRNKKYMSIDEFEHIIKQIKDISSYIYLHVQGEPLLHPYFDQILTICDNYDMHVQLVTNGTFIDKYMNIYQHPSLRKISFSLHSIDYQLIDPDIYINNILSFVKSASKNCFIELRFWTIDNISYKMQKIIDLLKRDHHFELTSKKLSYKLSDNLYIYFQNSFTWPINAHNHHINGFCYAANNMLAILVNGDVSICCLDSDGKINIGNIFETDIKKILASQHYKDIISAFNQNKCIESLCQQCTYRDRFNK